jgi:capsular polysaccharide biosynthesis protein
VWLNEKDTFKHLKEEFPDKDVILIDMGKLSLNETVHLMDKTEILFGLHGSAMWNVFFMYHTSALVEIWPIGYFEAKYYNQPRFVGVTYVYEEALQGNWPGHDPWTTIALSQSSRLVNLSRALVDAKRKKLV